MNKNITLSNNPIIIAVDNGYGNIKTENVVFKNGLETYTSEPTVNNDYYKIRDKYYVIAENRLTYIGDKTSTNDCRILTQIAIVKEMEYRNIISANIHLAVGLPLAWCSKSKKQEFIEYLSSNTTSNVIYKNVSYHINILSVNVYPQGFAAICGRYNVKGANVIADIGNGTLNMMQIIDGKPIENSILTERIGIGLCMRDIQKEVSKLYNDNIPETIIEPYLINGCNGTENNIAAIIKNTATSYSEEILKKIYSNGFKPDLMRLYIVGGGGCIIKNFTDIVKTKGVVFIDDICANAKGYAFLEKKRLQN